jgi:hypothetical protein|tara:strand:- start:1258 stop:1497 length:240 start_codon:yes stop_codon:yes gene_type:complete
MIDILQKYAMILGVVTAIGGGFYAWGEFNTRLDAVSAAVGSDTIENMQKDMAILDKKIEVLEAKLDEFRSGLNNPLGNR